MNKKCIIIQPLIPHYRFLLFKLIDNDLKGKVSFGFDFSNKKSINNDKSAFKLSCLNIRWLKFGPFIINPEFLKLPFYNFQLYIFNDNIRCIFLIPTILIIKLIKNKKVILWGHGYGTNNPLIGDIARSFLYKISDEYIAYSERGLKNVLRLCPEIKSNVAKNTLDLEEFLKFSRRNLKENLKKKKYNKKFIFIYISRIEQEKEPLFALELIYEFLKKGIEIEFKVIGDGYLYSQLFQEIEILGLNDKVTLYGTVTDTNKIINIAKDADFLLHPGIIGLSTLIALSLGIPVITSKTERQMPEFEVLEDKYNAIFIDIKSKKNSLRKIMRFLDRDILCKMSIDSFSSISNNEEYSINYMKNNFVKWIKNNGI